MKTTKDNLLILPIIKKPELNIPPESINEITDDQYEEIAEHYTTQLTRLLMNHGFKMDDFLFRDLYLVFEAIKSAMMRSNNKYNPIQDYSDLVYESMSDPLNDEESEQKEENNDIN